MFFFIIRSSAVGLGHMRSGCMFVVHAGWVGAGFRGALHRSLARLRYANVFTQTVSYAFCSPTPLSSSHSHCHRSPPETAKLSWDFSLSQTTLGTKTNRPYQEKVKETSCIHLYFEGPSFGVTTEKCFIGI